MTATGQRIIGLSGRRQSGKNTSANFIFGLELGKAGLVQTGFEINPKGQLYLHDLIGDDTKKGLFDPFSNEPAVKDFLGEHVNPYVRMYSFADILKQDVCMKILGLTYEQCYGTDEQKKGLTDLKWENMPGVVTSPITAETDMIEDFASISYLDKHEIKGRLGKYHVKQDNVIHHEPGQMTAREVLQFVGTEIFRRIYGDVWAKATLEKIKRDGAETAIIVDLRFPNEVFFTQDYGGLAVRLTKVKFTDDTHESETALDKDKFDWHKFNGVMLNDEMSIKEQNDCMFYFLKQNGWYEFDFTVSDATKSKLILSTT